MSTESFYNSELQDSSFSLFSETINSSMPNVEFSDNYGGGFIAQEIKLPLGLSNVIGMNKDQAKALLELQGWTFYTGYQAYPDGLFSGQGDNPGPSTGINTVSAVYEFNPYRSLSPGTENTGQQIVIYYWSE